MRSFPPAETTDSDTPERDTEEIVIGETDESGETDEPGEIENPGEIDEPEAAEASDDADLSESIELDGITPAFEQSETVSGVTVTVRAEEGAFPAGATLSVKTVSRKKEKQANAAIDAAKDDADYVIGLGHLGVSQGSEPWTSREVIANTYGFDAFLDGHSHTVVSETVKDKNGNDVLLAQTGTKLANAGRLTIASDGTISHENIDLAEVEADADTTALISQITERFEALQNQVVARTEVELTINDDKGIRAVRNAETNLGDLCADAYRVLMGGDVAFVNGGGIRDSIAAGDITYGDIIRVHPFGNEICLVEVTGQQIKDCLELGARDLPEESGGFQHVSGMTYTVNTAIPSSVVLDEMGMFVKVDGAYRVTDIQIGGEPLDVEKTYALASHNYLLKSQGSGASMFGTDNVTIIKDCVMIDNQALIRYIVDELGGIVGQEYAQPQGRITVLTTTESYEELPSETDDASTGDNCYVVVSGDCLWNIARRFYGFGIHYTKIAEANGLENPDYLRVGQVLTIPTA